jgi:hypothetical protein
MADPKMVFTAYQAKQLLQMFDDEEHRRVVVRYGAGCEEDGTKRVGIYACDEDFPEDGAVWLDEQEPLPDLILRLHREGSSADEIAAEIAALDRLSEAEAAGLSIEAVIADAHGVPGTLQPEKKGGA